MRRRNLRPLVSLRSAHEGVGLPIVLGDAKLSDSLQLSRPAGSIRCSSKRLCAPQVETASRLRRSGALLRYLLVPPVGCKHSPSHSVYIYMILLLNYRALGRP